MRRIKSICLIAMFAVGFTQLSIAQVEVAWEKLPGKAKDIAANSSGKVWIIGINDSHTHGTITTVNGKHPAVLQLISQLVLKIRFL